METTRLTDAIKREKEKNGVLVLSHVYQSPDIIRCADIVGDSFLLSKKAAQSGAARIVMCGVRFMAQTVKLLCPDACVLLPEPLASCPMAQQISPERVIDFKRANPGAAVVCYINTTAQLKAVCDVCVTSSSAVKIVSRLPQRDILFIPDKNLGSYVQKALPDKNLILWEGCCPVHNAVTEQDVLRLKAEYPDAVLAVHPECPPQVTRHADMTGATTEIIDYAKAQRGRVIIGTEQSVAEFLNLEENTDRFIQLKPGEFFCEGMRLTTLEHVYRAVTGDGGEEIQIDKKTMLDAKKMP